MATDNPDSDTPPAIIITRPTIGINEATPLLRDDSPHVLINGEEHTIIPQEPSNKKLALVLGTIYVGVFLGALDSTIIATLSAPISSSFNSLSLLSWLATAYLIANAACQPLSGRLTDIYSRRTGLVISNILFAVGNLICGLAETEAAMIAGRVVAGMGGGGLMAISTFVSSDLVPLRKRGIIQGIGNVFFGLGSGLGGLFGGWINDVWGWRVAFLAQVPFVLVSAVLVYFIIDIPPKESDKSRLKRVDFVGAGTLTASLVLLLLGLNSGGNIVPWTSWLVLTSLPLAVVVLGVFVWVEANWASEPVIPVRLLVNRTVAAACLTNWFVTMAMFAVIFYVPIYFQLLGLSTKDAGIRLIPWSVGSSLGSVGAGLVMKKTGKYYVLGLVVLVLFVLGTGLLSFLDFDTPMGPGMVFLLLSGIGYGGMLTVTLLATISAVDHEHQYVELFSFRHLYSVVFPSYPPYSHRVWLLPNARKVWSHSTSWAKFSGSFF